MIVITKAYWPMRIAEVAADLERSRLSKSASAHLDRDSLKAYIHWLKFKAAGGVHYDDVVDSPVFVGSN